MIEPVAVAQLTGSILLLPVIIGVGFTTTEVLIAVATQLPTKLLIVRL